MRLSNASARMKNSDLGYCNIKTLPNQNFCFPFIMKAQLMASPVCSPFNIVGSASTIRKFYLSRKPSKDIEESYGYNNFSVKSFSVQGDQLMIIF